MGSSSLPPLSQSYVNEYSGYRLKDIAIIFIALETVFVALRFWSRRLQKASIGWDDILIAPAYLSCLGPCIAGILAVKHGGVGHHIDAVIETTPEKVAYWGRTCLVAVPVLYAVATTIPKFVILAVYLRIFVDKKSRIVCYIVGAVLMSAVIVNVALSIWQCSPVAYAWDKTIPGGHCSNNVQAHIRWGSLPNIITDVVMLILPLPVVWKLHTSRRSKIGLTITFLTGSIGLLASIWRFAEFFSENAFDDGTWASVNLVVWCCVEPGVYLIAACLLALRPLLNFILHDKPLSTLLLRFRTRRTKDYSNFSNEDSQRHGIELTSDTKKQGFGVPQRLDEDRQALNWEYNGTGNNMQSTAERVESVSPLPVMMDRVHVRQEFSLDVEGGSIKT